MGKKSQKKRDEVIDRLSKRLREIEKQLKKPDRHQNSGDDYTRTSPSPYTRSRSRSSPERSRQRFRTRSRSRRRTRTHSRSRVSCGRSRYRENRDKRTPSHQSSLSRSPTPTPLVAYNLVSPIKDIQTNKQGGVNIEEGAAHSALDNSVSTNIEQLLGEDGVLSTSNAIDLHDSLVKRWSAILQNGLNAETNSSIVKKYNPPNNCYLLVPPKLNEEVVAALNDSTIKRDQKIRGQQVTLAAAITSIGKILNNLIVSQGNDVHIEALSDSARLLCGLYHNNSIIRRSLILPGLNKDMKELMEHTPVSEYLFGDKLQDKVNAIKAVKKSGQELKNTTKQPAKQKHLNYRGPQRQQMPRPSGQKQKLKQTTQYVAKRAVRTRRSPQKRHHPRRRGQDRR